MPPKFDSTWHRRALQGDAAAVAELAESALGAVYRFCFYRVGRDRHLCEEVVQETLVRAIRDLDRYQPDRADGDIFPWLSGLARNEIRRVLARERPAAGLERMWARMDDDLRRLFGRIESEALDDETLRQEETCEMVGATMSQLPSQYRRALEAKYVAGLSVRDIAAAFSMSEKAVESQLSRARRAFRETFTALAQNLSIEAEPLS